MAKRGSSGKRKRTPRPPSQVDHLKKDLRNKKKKLTQELSQVKRDLNKVAPRRKKNAVTKLK